MPFDFNAPASSAFNAGKESDVRNAMMREAFAGTFSIRFWYKPSTHDQYGINQGFNGSRQDFLLYQNNSAPSDQFDWWGLGRVGVIGGGGDPTRLHMQAYKASISAPTIVVSQSFFGGVDGPWRHVAAGIVRTLPGLATHLWIQIDDMSRLFIPTPILGPMPLSVPSVPGWHLRMRAPGYFPGTSSPNGSFRSYIDELAVWRDHYLTEDEVADSYNAGAGVGFAGTPSPSKLIAYWDMEGFSTTTPSKTLTDEVSGYDLVADPFPGGTLGFPEGTGEIAAGKIGNALDLWGAWDATGFEGFITHAPSDWYLQADPENKFDFGVEGF